jgi:hypothetical protein
VSKYMHRFIIPKLKVSGHGSYDIDVTVSDGSRT